MSIFSAFATSIFTNTLSYAELKESEEKFRTIFEGARDALLIINPHSAKIIDCNKQTVDWLGYSKKELLKMNHIIDLFPPEHKKKEMLYFKKVVKKMRRGSMSEITLLGKGGSEKLGEIKAADIRYQGRDLIQLAIRDIAERKEMEEELRKTKEFLEDVIETIGDGLLICDEKGHVLSVNSALENMYGYKREELVGQHVSVLAMKGDEELRKKALENAAELFEKGNASHESVFKRKDGKLVEAECNSSMIRDKDGNYIAGVTIFRDISERKKVEREIREGKDFLENVFETSADAIMVTDPKGEITMVNDSLEIMTGYSRDELVGKQSSLFTPPDKEILSKVVRELKKFFKEE
ncbi:MAG: PAS domain S-box protein, partial [Deltaproteobacteria bacterium]|nr:PAS domain S-box protein [Deltaproteobacteria bacterium]